MNVRENSLWKKVGYWHQGQDSHLNEKVGKAVKKRTFDYVILWSVSLYKTVKMKKKKFLALFQGIIGRGRARLSTKADAACSFHLYWVAAIITVSSVQHEANGQMLQSSN